MNGEIERPVLPAPIRRTAAVLALCCAAGLITLAAVFHGGVTYGPVDRWIYDRLPTGPGVPYGALGRIADIVPPLFMLIVAGLTVVMLMERRWRYAAVVALGPALTMLVTEVGKRVVDRTLEGRLALPSGHTAGVTSVTLVVVLLVLDRLRRRPALTAALGLAAVTLAAAIIGIVMSIPRWHYPTDTVAGYCTGVACTLAVAFAVDRVGPRVPDAGLLRSSPHSRGPARPKGRAQHRKTDQVGSPA